MVTKGHCKHGEFILEDGCPLCIVERRVMKTTPSDGFAYLHEVETRRLDNEETIITTGTDIQIISYFNEALKLQQYAETRIIKTLEDAKIANDDLTIIARLKKAMEARRKEELRPIDEARKSIQDNYNKWMAPVLAADTVTRSKMSTFNAEQERVRHEQEEINRKRMEAAEAEMRLKGELSEPVNLVEVLSEIKRVVTDQGTTGQRDNWTYEITDFALLPDEYKLPNTSALNAFAKSTKGTRQVPGLRIFNNPVIVVRPNVR